MRHAPEKAGRGSWPSRQARPASSDLALALKYQGDSRQAAGEFQAAIGLKPNWADAHYGLGTASYDLHDQPAALKELRAALALAICQTTFSDRTSPRT